MPNSHTFAFDDFTHAPSLSTNHCRATPHQSKADEDARNRKQNGRPFFLPALITRSFASMSQFAMLQPGRSSIRIPFSPLTNSTTRDQGRSPLKPHNNSGSSGLPALAKQRKPHKSSKNRLTENSEKSSSWKKCVAKVASN